MYKVNLAIKRIFDIISSGLLTLLLTPLWIVVAVWIKRDSDGPVFFRQGRRTKNGLIPAPSEKNQANRNLENQAEQSRSENICQSPEKMG